MEISNRSVGLLCATAVVVAIIARSGGTQSVAAKSPEPDNSPTVSQPSYTSHRAVDSDFSLINQQVAPTDNGVRSAKIPPTSDLNPEDGAPVQDDANVETDPLADLYGNYDAPDTPAAGIRERTNNTAAWANDEPLDQIGDLSDRELYDRWISMMDDEQRAQFRVVWVAMTPEERQKFIDDMRGNSSPN